MPWHHSAIRHSYVRSFTCPPPRPASKIYPGHQPPIASSNRAGCMLKESKPLRPTASLVDRWVEWLFVHNLAYHRSCQKGEGADQKSRAGACCVTSSTRLGNLQQGPLNYFNGAFILSMWSLSCVGPQPREANPEQRASDQAGCDYIVESGQGLYPEPAPNQLPLLVSVTSQN